ncbi:hypothetical protein BY996DRAFT_6544904 [Phakopsora pachyrhizi]|uniref:Uncharacterized protein n=1 Tax=Phakopsora pachyrhizi TaxID=170000 RepID=A0AAV0BBK7_PHAPC|nr:hypothetical protein BY996DRAFT_6544904 [Phakopsora pachyrhizi]CAH7682503.1 hypothetical protein PPACK8108_LOCUS15439 [Phakopsora pachyrhizi]
MRLGIPDSNIILMLVENMACNPRNMFPRWCVAMQIGGWTSAVIRSRRAIEQQAQGKATKYIIFVPAISKIKREMEML